MTRRFLLLATAAALMTTACDQIGNTADRVLNGPHPTVTVVLFDNSRSINPDDRRIYLASIQALGGGLNGGDRLLFAAIGDQTRASFRAALDLRIARTDVRLDQEDALHAARAELAQKASSLLAAGGEAENSRILEAIAAASEAFRSSSGANHRLILLTDAVEESSVVNLDRAQIAPEEVRGAIERARSAGLVPDLSGVELSIIGVGGRDFQGVESFWRAYSVATRAALVRYGRLPYEQAQ